MLTDIYCKVVFVIFTFTTTQMLVTYFTTQHHTTKTSVFNISCKNNSLDISYKRVHAKEI